MPDDLRCHARPEALPPFPATAPEGPGGGPAGSAPVRRAGRPRGFADVANARSVRAATKWERAGRAGAGPPASVLVVAKATGGRKGFSWGTLATAVVAALFVGSLVGGLFGSKRRPAPRISVYSAVQRRIEEE